MAAFAAVVLAMNASPVSAADPAWTKKAASPDAGKIAMAQAWDRDTGSYYEVTVRAGEKLLYKNGIQPEREVNYFRFSWSRDSRALLIGEGAKSSMDLTLVRFVDGKARATHFDSDKLIDGALLKTLPFREEIKNRAPVGGVDWHGIRWDNDKNCNMIYIFSGIGYEGEAWLAINWKGHDPELKITKIIPKKLNTKDFDDL